MRRPWGYALVLPDTALGFVDEEIRGQGTKVPDQVP